MRSKDVKAAAKHLADVHRKKALHHLKAAEQYDPPPVEVVVVPEDKGRGDVVGRVGRIWTI